MQIMERGETALRDLVHYVQNFRRDLGSLLAALGVWGPVFLVCQALLGILPIALAAQGGKLIDSLIGARGISVVTSDLRQDLLILLVILVLGLLASAFLTRFTGKAAQVGAHLRDGLMALAGCVFLIYWGRLAMALLVPLLLLVDIALIRFPKARLAVLFVTFGSIIAASHRLVLFAVNRSFTVGEAIGVVAALFILGAMVAARSLSGRQSS